MNSLLQGIRIAAYVWGGALVLLVAGEVRGVRRLVPDWLRTVSRAVVLVGTIAVLATAALVGARLFQESLAARPVGDREGTTLDISFESVDKFFLSLYLSSHQSEMNEPAGDNPVPVTFVVESGETAASVALRLADAGLVTNSEVFRRFMSYNDLDVSLEAGVYTLRATMTMHEIAQALQSGSTAAVTVTIPEGWRAEQVAWLLEQQELVRSDDFLAYVESAIHSFDWLPDLPPGATLEGFLFPDTYELSTEATAADIVDLMVANFGSRAASEIDSRLSGKELFDLSLGTYRAMTMYDVVILASIVEREAVVDEERPVIASVYFNRLDPEHIGETALRLSSDPTIQYAKGLDPETGNWWNPMLPGEGLTVDSPYNTFRVQGLPPGPICSPGLASILAVLNPAETSYLYFHAVGEGQHVFASTLEEHLRNQEQYAP